MVNHVTVKQAATITTKDFGDQKDVGRTLVENFASIEINFSFTNKTYERETFMKLKSLTATYENTQPITPEQHAALIVTIEKKLKPEMIISERRVTVVNPVRMRPGSLHSSVLERTLLKEVANYGDPVGRHTYSSREIRYDERVTQVPKAQQLIIPEQRSFSAAVYAKAALKALPLPPPTQPTAPLERRTSNDPPVQMRPRPPPPPYRSYGHAGHEIRDCPALFFSDGNNELHLQWKDSTMGRL